MSEDETKLFHSGDRTLDEALRGRLSRVLSGQLERIRSSVGNGLWTVEKSGDFTLYGGVNGNVFHDIFEIAQKYLRYGELVDLHGIKTTEDGIVYDDCCNYLSDDGLSCFSITPKGKLKDAPMTFYELFQMRFMCAEKKVCFSIMK